MSILSTLSHLKFLVRGGYVTNVSLYQALGGPTASSEHIANVKHFFTW